MRRSTVGSVFIAMSQLAAQVDTGAISGLVKDKSGAASVPLLETDTSSLGQVIEEKTI